MILNTWTLFVVRWRPSSTWFPVQRALGGWFIVGHNLSFGVFYIGRVCILTIGVNLINAVNLIVKVLRLSCFFFTSNFPFGCIEVIWCINDCLLVAIKGLCSLEFRCKILYSFFFVWYMNKYKMNPKFYCSRLNC